MAEIRNVSREELEAQRAIMARMARRNAALEQQPLALVDTYGCQQNEADSERIRGMLREMGWAFTEREEEADLIVVNTCAVRGHAELRALGNVGALSHTKRARPDQKIALCGCMVQQAHMVEKVKKSFPYVDLVFGTHELWRLPELLEKLCTPHKGRIFQARQIDGERYEGLPVLRSHPVRAWLSIMNGCNNFCTYCVVPYVRGRERSRAPEQVLQEAREIIAAGHKEIYLLGQNVNSYGKDLGGGTDFSDLLRALNDLEGDFILRFMTSHPKDASEKLFETMAACEKVERHIHLPVQAGNDRVLKAMNRVYDSEAYLKKVDFARQCMPDIAITSDIIVGFPGETHEDYLETKAAVERIQFDNAFVFQYSPRRDTVAAAMDNQICLRVKEERNHDLLETVNRIAVARNQALVGSQQTILVEGPSKNNPDRLQGRTSQNKPVIIPGGTAEVGTQVPVRIAECTGFTLYGDVV